MLSGLPGYNVLLSLASNPRHYRGFCISLLEKKVMSVLFTIGYEGASVDDFLETLKTVDVAAVLDVRQVSSSRRPGFSKNQLREALEAVGIGYYHFAGLGDPKEGRLAARRGQHIEFKRIFNLHMETPKAQADLEAASQLAQEKTCCLFCYEREPSHCHRSIVANKIALNKTTLVRHLGVKLGHRRGTQRARAGAGPCEGAAACR